MKTILTIIRNFKIFLLVFLIFSSIINIPCLDSQEIKQSTIFFVDDDFSPSTPDWNITRFSEIRNAINAANDYDTIFINEGLYPEILIIEKSLTILGNSTNSVIINGKNYTTSLITITADRVTISNLSIIGQHKAHYPREHCIYVSSNNNIFTNLNIQNSDYLITLENSKNNVLKQNTLHNYLLDGIQMENAHNNQIQHNSIHGSEGISVRFSNDNIICDNYIKGSELYVSYSIYMYDSENNLFFNNTIITTTIGLFISHSINNTFLKNDIEIDNYDMCGIYFESNSDCTIIDNNIHGDSTSEQGIWMVETNTTKIINNTITHANQGIYLKTSVDNIFSNNYITNNIQGICIIQSKSNIIHHNNITNNFYGIKLSLSKRNSIYDNIFSNEKNTETDFFGLFSWNKWNIKKTPGENIIGGKYLGGNYWGGPQGFTCKDRNNDGIGDSWYRIGIMGIDFSPLIKK